ncbi:MAG: transglycosylase domain-containing protein [Rhodospirillales bacterium]
MWPVFKWLAVAAIWLTVTLAAIVGWYAADLPDVDAALTAPRRASVTVVAADGSELATAGDRYGMALAIADLPPALPLAVLATEDRRFYQHVGVDVVGLARAVVANLRAGGVVQGGSTITQQAAKNLFLTPERTIKRKVQELILALWLERAFSKDQIFAIYLNRAYFGAGAYGVDAAARKYFGHSATRVSTYQAAMLAGLLKAPSRYNPLANPGLAAQRTERVLANMAAAGHLGAAEVDAARRHKGEVIAALGVGRGGRYFVDWILAQVPDFVGAGDRDLVVTTTLDPRLQRLAEARIAEMLDGPGVAAAASEAALVAMTAEGAVRAMVGGRDYVRSQFNRAVQAYRQPGSAFKPFVFLAGLEAGLNPDSRMVDGPLTIDGWQPRNFSGRYQGEVSLRRGLADSINTVAVRVSERAGRGRVIDAAHRLGITADLASTPSLALGTGDVSLVELTAAYATFANGGLGVWAYGIEAIHDADGRALYVRSGSGPGRIVNGRHAAALTEMLVEAVEQGTGRAARLPRPVAGKTGTSQNFRDAWFVGFTADLVAGVWMGNDDGRPMNKVTGGGLPAQLWRAFMVDAHGGLPVRPLPSLRPAGDAPRMAAAEEALAPGFWERLKSVFAADDDRPRPAIRRSEPDRFDP